MRSMSVASRPSPMMPDMFPQPTEAFAWAQAPGGLALVCRPLERVARHVFTTRGWLLGASRDERAWQEVAEAMDVPLATLVRLHQVHGANVVVHRASEPLRAPAGATAPSLSEADIVMSNDSQAAVAIQTADCVPLLIADPRSGAVVAAHAGWRGLTARVPIAAVEALGREFGSRPADLLAAIGPSIGA